MEHEWQARGHIGVTVQDFSFNPGWEAFGELLENIFIGQTLIKFVTFS
ncbi:unnamed protein product [marine sediment metagenome]|uniref:Uncharacterized protein n=1 Tax=marine sediment metagenome TaxID=412755 RepID=X0U8T0_9ZZZZ